MIVINVIIFILYILIVMFNSLVYVLMTINLFYDGFKISYASPAYIEIIIITITM